MGCKPSKQSVCRNCNAQCSPVRRSYSSLPRHSYSSPRKDHVVALTSTTLGYLQQPVRQNGSSNFEAETWSKLIEENVAKVVLKTPVGTPPGEPETINAWELMEGLDDSSPDDPPTAKLKSVDHSRCFLFNGSTDSILLDRSTLLSHRHFDSNSSSNMNEASVASDFDPNATNIKSLFEADAKNSLQRGKKEKLILYFSSLRGVRKTYEDCCDVRVILKNTGFRVDERDVSMHSGFKDELKELLGDRYGGGGLPKVFVGRKYIGGADEIRRFHEELQLDKVLEDCEIVDDRGGGCCEACGDIRFLPCETCSGSCKIYYEVNSDEAEKEVEEESDYGFQRCHDCNENGLIRCPICCD